MRSYDKFITNLPTPGMVETQQEVIDLLQLYLKEGVSQALLEVAQALNPHFFGALRYELLDRWDYWVEEGGESDYIDPKAPLLAGKFIAECLDAQGRQPELRPIFYDVLLYSQEYREALAVTLENLPRQDGLCAETYKALELEPARRLCDVYHAMFGDYELGNKGYMACNWTEWAERHHILYTRESYREGLNIALSKVIGLLRS